MIRTVQEETDLSSPGSILVIDDEPHMLRYMRTLLEVDSYRVETLSSGLAALDRLQKEPLPDLVLLDVVMPDLDGLQTRSGMTTSSRTRSGRSEEHTSELQSRLHLVCRLLLEKKK